MLVMRRLLIVLGIAILALSAGVGFVLSAWRARTSTAASASETGVPIAAAPRSGDRETETKLPVAAPKVVVAESEHDFGAVDFNTEAFHQFVIRNEGTAPLQLQLGKSTCRCTTGDVPKEPIPPGGETLVTIRFLEERHHGPFRQYAEIVTNDPNRNRVTLTISGVVKARLAVDPESLQFSQITPGLPAARSVTVYSQLWPEFWLEIEQITLEGVECRVTPVAAEAIRHLDALSGYRIDVLVPASLTHAAFQGEIHLRLVSPSAKEPQTLVIPFAGSAASRIEIDSAYLGGGRLLNFGRIPQGKRVAAELMVRTRDLQRPLGLKEVVCDPPHLRVALEPQADSPNHYRLTIEIPADSPRFVRLRGNSGKVKVVFDDPAETSFEFMVWAAVVDPEIGLPR